MIQDIYPMVYHNEYREFEPDGESTIITFTEDKILAGQQECGTRLPKYKEISFPDGDIYYLFSIQEEKYFLLILKEDTPEKNIDEKDVINISETGLEYTYIPIGGFREMLPRHVAFASVTAYQLFRWYKDHRFCGRCGGNMQPDTLERMMRCPACSNSVYPTISPAVIVGVVDGDRILLTRYAGRSYKRYALVAGFAEIGESLEQTVAREVMEEVGLKVKNIRYYKSQPWSFSSSLLAGFYADLDGSDEIILDETELSEGVWLRREEITDTDDGMSLTREMIQAFIDNKVFV